MKQLLRLKRSIPWLLSLCLLAAWPVTAAEEWDGAFTSVEEVLSFEASEDPLFASDDLLFSAEEDILTAHEEFLQSITIKFPAIFNIDNYSNLKAGDQIPQVPALAYGFLKLEGLSSDGNDFSSYLSVKDIYWSKTQPVRLSRPEKTTDTHFQEEVYYLCMVLDTHGAPVDMNATASIFGSDLPLMVVLSATSEVVVSTAMDMTKASVTVEDLALGLPAEAMSFLSPEVLLSRAIPAGTPIPTLPFFVGSVNGQTAETDAELYGSVGLKASYFVETDGSPVTDPAALAPKAEGTLTAPEYLLVLPVESLHPLSESLTVSFAGAENVFFFLPANAERTSGFLYTGFSTVQVGPTEVTPEISLEEDSFTYTGEEIHPAVRVSADGKDIPETAYAISYSEGCTDAGTYEVTVSLQGEYTGSAKASFTIAAKSLSKASITVSPKTLTYNGKKQTPAVTVVLDGHDLTEGKDYTLSFSSNQNVGTAKVKVKGKGNYKGSAKASFTIAKAEQSLKVSAKTVSLKKSALSKAKQTVEASKAMTVSGAQGKLSYKKASGDKALSISSSGKLTVKKGTKKGTYKIKVKVTSAATSNYQKATKDVTLKVKVK